MTYTTRMHSNRVRRKRSTCGAFIALSGLLGICAQGQLQAQSTTATQLTVSSGAVAWPNPVTFTATVTTGGKPVTPGLVKFCNAAATNCQGPALLGQAQLTSTGAAVIKLPFSIGVHSVKAVFGGTTANAASGSTAVNLSVTGLRSTSTALTASAASPYTLTATVSGIGSQTLSGNVSFLDGSDNNFSLGTAALSAATTTAAFAPLTMPVTGSEPRPLVVGDFNGDGFQDVAVGNFNPDRNGFYSIILFLTRGAAYLPPVTFYLPLSANGISALAAGDFNNDGKLDLAIANENSNTVTIASGDGAGNFTIASQPSTQVYPNSIAAGDFNADGNADLAITNQGSSSVTILLGNGQGGFTAASQSPATDATPYSIAAGDFNGDGKQDLAIANYFANDVTVLLGKGDGTFTAAASPPTGVYPDWLAVGDFNGDGKQDLAVTNQFSKTVTILIGNGAGAFTPEPQSPAAGTYPESVAVGDFNGDGIADLVVTNSNDNTATILRGLGDGTFPTSQTVALGAGTAPYSAVIADFDSDGRQDFAIAGSGNNTMVIAFNNVSTVATAAISGINIPGGGTHNVYATYGGNGTYGGSTAAAPGLAGTPIATSTALNVEPTGTVAVGETVQLTARVSPAFAGSLSATGNVLFYSGTSLLATVPVVSGLAVFDDTIKTAGSETLSARYTGDGNFVTSSSGTTQLTGIVRTASAIILSASSKSVAAGTVVTLTANVVSAGNPVTQGTVTFCNSNYRLCEDGAVLGTGHLTSAGTAALNIALPAGSNPVIAYFNGTAVVAGSKSNGQIIVVSGALASATSVAVTGTPGNYTFTANVTGSWPPLLGQVSLIDASNGNLPLASGFLQTGNPKFAQSSAPAVGTGAYSAAVGDFNGDGKPDIAVGNSIANTLTILLGNGNGAFTPAASSITGTPAFSQPYAIVVGDFNGDGKPDLAVANTASNYLTILLGNGNGTFTVKSKPTAGAGPSALAVGDFNGDGKLDLAATNYSGGNVTVLLGNGDGTFSADAESPATGVSPDGIAAADFNGDGKTDLAVANLNSGTVTILLGKGDGTFTPAAFEPNSGNTPNKIAVADFNEDGIPDVAITSYGYHSVTILLGKGDGTFTPSPSVQTGLNPYGIAAGDFNSDGFTDLVICNQGSASLTLLLGNGDGTFIAQTIPLASGSAPITPLVADFNSDGGPDLAVTDISSNVVRVLPIASVSTSYISNVTVPGGGTHQITAAYAATTPYAASTSNAVAATATPIPTTTVLVESPSMIPAGTIITVKASVSPVSADNFSVSGTVSLYDGTTLVATNTLSNAQSTFSFAPSALGTHSLTAKFSGSTNFAANTSLPVAVSVAPASSTALSVSAISVTSATPQTFTATVVSGGKPVMPGIVTFCNAAASACANSAVLGTANLSANGVASLKLTLGVGTYSIKAVFSGTVNALASTSAAQSITVKGLHPTTTTLTDSVVSGKYTLTAVVKASGIQAPTGNVSFSAATLSGNTSLGTAALGTPTAPALSFTSVSNSPATATPTAVAVADFNRDGKPDLAVATGGSLIISLGNGNGTFTEQSAIGFGNGTPVSMAVGDFNGDGIPDIAAVNFVSNTVAILIGNGDGAFTAKPSPVTGASPIAVTVGDFNADGKLDVAVANNSSYTASILLGNGDGTFAAQIVVPIGETPRGVAVGDFNRDGRPDLAVATYGSHAVILLGNGNGTFTTATPVPVGRTPERVVVADFNADGNPDVAVANSGDGTLTVALGKGDGTFGTPSTISLGTGVTPRWLGVGDFDQDGKVDLVVTVDNKAETLILLGDGHGTFVPQIAASPTANPPQFLALADFNGDGEPDLGLALDSAFHASVLLNSLSTSATATLSGVTISGTTNQSVQAQYAGSTVDAASASIAISLPPM